MIKKNWFLDTLFLVICKLMLMLTLKSIQTRVVWIDLIKIIYIQKGYFTWIFIIIINDNETVYITWV